LQDELAELKAILREEKPERVKNETDFKSNRGYKSVYSRVREQALFNKRNHQALEVEEAEKQYEKVTVSE
jgi:hypothetical protein